MLELQAIEKMGMRVLTSKQLAKAYDTEPIQLQQNYSNNKKRFVEGKHYIYLVGEELRKFKSNFENFKVVAKTTNRLYLWTEKGALLHAKSLNTDKAWEVYDYLVDFYFRAKETTELKEQGVSFPMSANERKLTVGDELALAYNRGIVLGVFRNELEESSTLEIYERLSARGKGVVMNLIFREGCYVQ